MDNEDKAEPCGSCQTPFPRVAGLRRLKVAVFRIAASWEEGVRRCYLILFELCPCTIGHGRGSLYYHLLANVWHDCIR